MCMYIPIYVYIYIYMYIHMYRERYRYVYIYIYIERERCIHVIIYNRSLRELLVLQADAQGLDRPGVAYYI